LIQSTFTGFLERGDAGLIIMNQPVADRIRATIAAHTDKVPMVLEIPSSGGNAAFDPRKDPILLRVMQMLGEE
jgi:V-type H+-transporting ATPase subunit F